MAGQVNHLVRQNRFSRCQIRVAGDLQKVGHLLPAEPEPVTEFASNNFRRAIGAGLQR